LTDAVAGSLLAETGNDVKVVQELMRHAKVATAMEVYTHAGMGKKRMAQSRVVDVRFDRRPQDVGCSIGKVVCSQILAELIENIGGHSKIRTYKTSTA
jgi:hypothetical protein